MLGSVLPVSMLLLIVFIKHQKQSPSAMLDLSLFSNPDFSYASMTRIFGFMSRTSSMLLLPVFLLNIMQLNEGTIGLIMLVSALGMGIRTQSGGRLSDNYGPRRFMIFGFFVAMINALFMAFFNQNSSLLFIVTVLFINGISMSLWATPNQVMTMNATPRSSYGPVGSLVNPTRNTGNVIGQAIITAVTSITMSYQGFDIKLSEIGTIHGSLGACVNGWRVSFLVIIGFIAFALLGAFLAKPSETTDRKRNS